MTGTESSAPSEVCSSDTLQQLVRWWQEGSYELLANVKLSEILPHPDQSKMAILVAAGHYELGDIAEAKRLIYSVWTAKDARNFTKRFLLAHAHYLMAEASCAMGQPEKAIDHIEATFATAPFIGDVSTVAKRMQDLAKRASTCADDPVQSTPSFPSSKKAPTSQLTIGLEVFEKIEEQTRIFQKFQGVFEVALKKELFNNARQLEAFFGIQNYLNHGEILPEMHGWPVSPDLGLWLINLIQENHYDVVVEFGSGTSTVLIAKALEAKRKKLGEHNRPSRQIAFEHLEKYQTETIKKLKSSLGFNSIEVILAPLTMQKFTGGKYPYYNCRNSLQHLAANLSALQPLILVLVDGPPAQTGKYARYPAVPTILKHFPTADVDVLLDDYARADEKHIVEMWCKILEEDNRYCYSLDIKEMEKDACLISIRTVPVN